MKSNQIFTALFVGVSPIFLSSIPAEAFNLVYNTSPIYSSEYTFASGEYIGRVWIDEIQKILPPDNTLLNAFRQQFPAWEFEASYTPIYGNLEVDEYSACIPALIPGVIDPCGIGSAVGGLLNLSYVPRKFFDPELGQEYNDFPDPNTGQVHWVQWIENNHNLSVGIPGFGIHGVEEKSIDTTSNTPFYYGERLGPNMLGSNTSAPGYFEGNRRRDFYRFSDNSRRTDILEDHDWTANLYLAYSLFAIYPAHSMRYATHSHLTQVIP